ncbi:MAG: alkaline phosphatase [Atribacterota bacterium]|nr:alkaline phosphatase [Atribacterota bacterium]
MVVWIEEKKLLRGCRVFLGIVFLILLFSESAAAFAPRFIFLFIGDGMGENDVRLLTAYQKSYGLIGTFSFLSHVGTVDTSSLGAIPDSASSGTALACGVKTRNGIIGLDPSGKIVPSIAEIAKKKGLRVGIITNVAINDATPASFYAHCSSRRDYAGIAIDMVESNFDLFVGWGIASPGEAISLATKNGYTVVENWDDFLSHKTLPLIALLSFPFSIDREEDRTLRDAVRQGIGLLFNDQGFFLLVESGKIDWCKHMNDVGSLLFELLDFDGAVGEALAFAQKYPQETLILVTGDHETGGIEIGTNVDFSRILSQPFSYQTFLDRVSSGESLLELAREMWHFGEALGLKIPAGNLNKTFVALAREFSQQVGIFWTTTGHTSKEVPVFLWRQPEPSYNWQENTDVFRVFWDFLKE